MNEVIKPNPADLDHSRSGFCEKHGGYVGRCYRCPQTAAQTAPTLTPTKGQHPADGSDRWSVTGEHGKVVYDQLGNHLALLWADGDIDSVMGGTLARVKEYAELGDDDAVFAVLAADLYRTELVGGAR